LTDLVLGVGTTKVPQPYGVARKWTNSVASRKSYACGQRIDNNDDETIVEDVGNSKTATVRSVRHSMDSAITRPMNDVYANVGETYVMAETTTATTHEEEMAARALMGLSSASVATKMPTEIHQSPEKLTSSSSAQPVSVKNAVENEEISHSSSQTGNDTAGTQSLSLDVPHTGVPAVLKGTFNESSIEKITNEGDTHNESTLVATRSMREEMLNFLDASYGGHAKAPKSNRTLFSFKTPKKTNAGKSKVDIRRHSHHVATATTAQKDAVFEKRVTSTPYSEDQPHVCPRFAAHQARSLSPARTKQQKSAPSTPVSGSRMVRIGPGTRILHSPVVNVAKEDKSSPFRVPSIPSTTRRSQTTSVALQQIADYKSPVGNLSQFSVLRRCIVCD
uniref:TPX2_importin domain-containing protein n=1 Tax=Anisakis simplex TaxID=6269 RepID=A0A0M3J195_ANISI